MKIIKAKGIAEIPAKYEFTVNDMLKMADIGPDYDKKVGVSCVFLKEGVTFNVELTPDEAREFAKRTILPLVEREI